jgi:hypothetical protein
MPPERPNNPTLSLFASFATFCSKSFEAVTREDASFSYAPGASQQPDPDLFVSFATFCSKVLRPLPAER